MNNLILTPIERGPTLITPFKRVFQRVAAPNGAIGYQARDGLTLIASHDTEAHGTLLHLSVSRSDRLPSWPELLDAWRAFTIPPDPPAQPMLILPRWSRHINLHTFCLHLFAVPITWHDDLDRARKTAILVRVPQDRVPHENRPYPNTALRLRGSLGRPSYALTRKTRDNAFANHTDVAVLFDLPGRPNPRDLILTQTPEPWEAGRGV